MIDAGCGAGGNAIGFARGGARVTAIEQDVQRLAMARHNAEVYGVADQNRVSARRCPATAATADRGSGVRRSALGTGLESHVHTPGRPAAVGGTAGGATAGSRALGQAAALVPGERRSKRNRPRRVWHGRGRCEANQAGAAAVQHTLRSARGRRGSRGRVGLRRVRAQRLLLLL